ELRSTRVASFLQTVGRQDASRPAASARRLPLKPPSRPIKTRFTTAGRSKCNGVLRYVYAMHAKLPSSVTLSKNHRQHAIESHARRNDFPPATRKRPGSVAPVQGR